MLNSYRNGNTTNLLNSVHTKPNQRKSKQANGHPMNCVRATSRLRDDRILPSSLALYTMTTYRAGSDPQNTHELTAKQSTYSIRPCRELSAHKYMLGCGWPLPRYKYLPSDPTPVWNTVELVQSTLPVTSKASFCLEQSGASAVQRSAFGIVSPRVGRPGECKKARILTVVLRNKIFFSALFANLDRHYPIRCAKSNANDAVTIERQTKKLL